MKSIEIKGSLRTETGKKATRELRKSNSVPCVLYGINKDEKGNQVATHFTVTNDGLRNLVYTPHIYVVDLNIDGKIVTAIMKDIQFHPVTDKILHVDFLQIDESRKFLLNWKVLQKVLKPVVNWHCRFVSLKLKLCTILFLKDLSLTLQTWVLVRQSKLVS